MDCLEHQSFVPSLNHLAVSLGEREGKDTCIYVLISCPPSQNYHAHPLYCSSINVPPTQEAAELLAVML